MSLSRTSTEMALIKKQQVPSRFRLLFAGDVVNLCSGIPLGRLLVSMSRRLPPAPPQSFPRMVVGDSQLLFQVWGRHSCRESGNEGLYVRASKSRSEPPSQRATADARFLFPPLVEVRKAPVIGGSSSTGGNRIVAERRPTTSGFYSHPQECGKKRVCHGI